MNEFWVGWLLPALFAALLALTVPLRWLSWVARGYVVYLTVALAGIVSGWYRLADPVATWLYVTGTLLVAVGTWYSVPYIEREGRLHHWNASQRRGYWSTWAIFSGSLLGACLLDNYLAIWLAIEVATLSSVYLTGLPGVRTALEASWKYLFVTEAGGFAALVGTIWVVAGSGRAIQAWTFNPPLVHQTISPQAVAVGCLLVVIGYATKAGLAPFHTWLPDAHSEAPAPVSALLSGLKLAVALVAAYRLLTLVERQVPLAWTQVPLIALGLCSLVVGAALIGFQHDLKRLWAYSSIEHLGLISLGMGFGGLALVGAFLHIWTHGVTKSLLFHNSGTIRLLYSTSDHRRGARAILQTTPWTGSALALGTAAILGLPPLAPFWSEWLILVGGLQQPHTRIVALVAIALVMVVFVATTRRMPQWLWTPGRADATPYSQHAEPMALVTPSLVLMVLAIAGGLALPVAMPSLWQGVSQQLFGA
ncbi:MAG: nitroreductase family protein [Firmicutes bacterium]|nr:nitroreductase family protein [Bacillota bacterium]